MRNVVCQISRIVKLVFQIAFPFLHAALSRLLPYFLSFCLCHKTSNNFRIVSYRFLQSGNMNKYLSEGSILKSVTMRHDSAFTGISSNLNLESITLQKRDYFDNGSNTLRRETGDNKRKDYCVYRISSHLLPPIPTKYH